MYAMNGRVWVCMEGDGGGERERERERDLFF